VPVKKESIELDVALFDAKLTHIRDDVAEIKTLMRADHVRRDEFAPVKQVVFGLVGVVMLSVVAALVTLVLRQTTTAP
jgi:hypothetical protein